MNQNDPVPDDFTLSPALVDALPALFFLPATWYWWQEFCFYHEYAVSRKPLIYRRLPAHLLWTFYVDAIRVLDRNKNSTSYDLGFPGSLFCCSNTPLGCLLLSQTQTSDKQKTDPNPCSSRLGFEHELYGGELGTRTPDPLRVMHDGFSVFRTIIR